MLIGKKAPFFKATAIINGNEIIKNFSLQQIENKYILLFFYPKDFTFVCPTELLSFQEKINEFKSRNVSIIAVSTDSEYSHLNWLNTPIKNGGIQGVEFTLVSDINKTISYNYGVLSGEFSIFPNNEKNNIIEVKGELIPYRANFLIDKSRIIRHQSINEFYVGRNINEILRIIDAIQYFEKNGEVCPANWKKGEKGIKPNIKSTIEYLKKNF
ncbi:peroxiredoxin [Candidatus Shikimatogenerans silvanidophilus]|uniref:peroxiredoxin n=1 Tax=Candidatus Shikimatogenerans silvanidophilus TaxID=2782547 RepID=UPI001BA78CD2|nr:peroxiredoxin [Candidatus Shikimatogenerans silvanidophilus]